MSNQDVLCWSEGIHLGFMIEHKVLQFTEGFFFQWLNVFLKELNLECMLVKGLVKDLMIKSFCQTYYCMRSGKMIAYAEGDLVAEGFYPGKVYEDQGVVEEVGDIEYMEWRKAGRW